MTDEEILAAALSDPDAQPLTPERLARMKQMPRVKIRPFSPATLSLTSPVTKPYQTAVPTVPQSEGEKGMRYAWRKAGTAAAAPATVSGEPRFMPLPYPRREGKRRP